MNLTIVISAQIRAPVSGLGIPLALSPRILACIPADCLKRLSCAWNIVGSLRRTLYHLKWPDPALALPFNKITRIVPHCIQYLAVGKGTDDGNEIMRCSQAVTSIQNAQGSHQALYVLPFNSIGALPAGMPEFSAFAIWYNYLFSNSPLLFRPFAGIGIPTHCKLEFSYTGHLCTSSPLLQVFVTLFQCLPTLRCAAIGQKRPVPVGWEIKYRQLASEVKQHHARCNSCGIIEQYIA
ncbi:hypothetical protein L228DRAFT_45441 [Xylona heveae TC161]|uniref:Uncharacterized protein n=1 Tax=Xylona heveae (strain CBS 132557 / TC161) TaxID=1328760 RepID=A0A164ZU81_XYLHT|nr:hypothetical protein L228DRAFT_45441 [Xylona heveae TC161]KZF19525.1 hypothetical protein L228DRAFT_45441 [Xylona heveae TC161]